MGAHWQRQELDLLIMKTLYEYGPLMGSMLAHKLSKAVNCKPQKVYDRLKEMRGLHLIGNDQYTGLTWEDKVSRRPKRPKNLGKVFYLTGYGVQQTKQLVLDMELTGKERSQRPEEKDLEIHWQISKILANMDLEFTPGRMYKYLYDVPQNFTIDLGYGEWQIVCARNSKEFFKNLVHQQGRVLEQNGLTKRLILCGSKRQQIEYVKYLYVAKSPQMYVLEYKDYPAIHRLLTSDIIEDALQSLQEIYGEAGRLDTPKDGYHYTVGGRPANIYSLVGYPVSTMRRLEKSLTLKGYVGFADEEQRQYYEKRFPECIKNHSLFIIKEHGNLIIPADITKKQQEDYENWAVDLDLDLDLDLDII